MSKARGLADLGNAYSDGALSNRNLIINGAMQVAQRATTASAALSYVSLDRYPAFASGGGAWTLSQETDTPSGQGFKNSAKVTVDTADTSIAAGDYYLMQQRIEGQNIAHFKQGTSDAIEVTLSFWVKSSLTGDFGCSFNNKDTDRSHPFQYNIATANTWQKITKTVQLDTSGTWLTTNDIGLTLSFDLGTGATFQGPADAWADAYYLTASSSVQLIGTSAATWYITGVQLEVGDTATPFEHRSFGDELARCQRYYVNEVRGIWSGYTTNTVPQYVHSSFPVEMRVAPSCTVDTGGAAVLGFPATPAINVARSKDVLVQNVASATTAYGYFNYRVTADAEL